ncbi:hypothetical protein [Natrinema pallidum]|uniref:DUF5518 domain-containing protein n=1 Tax=Natrinema pallidum TaxID=69527 RepID=A0A4P9TDV8_9EURY|nr:hypothetical protein [Natrinema pallidum]QCW02936.1 hypothetical protein FGF80_06665 [Natrinema pallidum]
MSDHEETRQPVATVDTGLVLRAAAVGAFISLSSVLVPLFARIGGGVVAGGIAAYAAGRMATGLAYAVTASALAGGLAGFFMTFVGSLFGLYTEPPLFVFASIGPLSPGLSGLGLPSVVLLAIVFSLLTAVDGLIGGLIGSGLRLLRPW